MVLQLIDLFDLASNHLWMEPFGKTFTSENQVGEVGLGERLFMGVFRSGVLGAELHGFPGTGGGLFGCFGLFQSNLRLLQFVGCRLCRVLGASQ